MREQLKDWLLNTEADLVVDLYLYTPDAGGRVGPIGRGWGCPCCKEKSFQSAWDGYPQLESEMAPGERRRVGFKFLSGQLAVDSLGPSGTFYLSEGKIIGEATIV